MMTRLPRRLRLSLIMLSFSLVVFAGAQPEPITNIVYPVSGMLVFQRVLFDDPSDVSMLDTATGSLSSLIGASDGYSIGSLSLNSTGERVALGLNRVGEFFSVAEYNLTSNELSVRPSSAETPILFRPFGWINNDSALLQLTYSIEKGYGLVLTDVESGSNITTYFQQLALLDPVPARFSVVNAFDNAKLYAISQADLNPVAPDWISLSALIVDDTSGEQDSFEVGIGILHNLATEATLFVNDIVQGESFKFSDWSTDGRYIALNGIEAYYVLEFSSLDEQVGLVHSVPSMRRESDGQMLVEAMLGVQDLMLITTVSDDTLLLSIAQIQDGTLYRQPFVEFARSENVNTLDFDWHLTADEAERQTLSCLFDNALGTRLLVGIQARVNVTSGAPLSLYAEPSLESSVIAQLQDGSIVDIIGNPACFNGDSYSRLWQAQLANGMTGWAVEANTTNYYLEPFVPQPGAGWLLFVSNRPEPAANTDGAFNLYAADLSASSPFVQRLTNNADPNADDHRPVWSPDHTRVAFMRAIGADSDVCLLTLATETVSCTDTPDVREDYPAWSDSGLYLAYVSAADGELDIYKHTLNGDGFGAERVNLTHRVGTGGLDNYPDWHGDWIVYNSTRDGNTELYVMFADADAFNPADGQQRQQLTDSVDDKLHQQPAWSPLGDKIAYTRIGADGLEDTYIRPMTFSGGTWTVGPASAVTSNLPGRYQFMAWQTADPSQSTLAAVRHLNGNRDIVIITTGLGGGLSDLGAPVNTSADEDNPDW